MRTKSLNIDGQHMWVLRPHHDILLALLVEQARHDDRVPVEWLDDWAPTCSDAVLGANLLPETDDDRSLLAELLAGVRSQVTEHGDFSTADVLAWSGDEDLLVADGEDGAVTPAEMSELIDAVSSALHRALPSERFFWTSSDRYGRELADDPSQSKPNAGG